MSDDSGVQFLTARPRKRPHHRMSGSHYRSRSPWSQEGEPSSSRRRPRSPQPPPSSPPARYPGDGLDFRRPAMSSTNQQEPVIDLTNEPDSSPQRPQRRRRSGDSASPNARPPRFGRDILQEPDVVDLVDEPESPEIIDPPGSPEVQFVGATSRPRRFDLRSGVIDMMRRAARFGGDYYRGDHIWSDRYLRNLPPPLDVETLLIGEGAGRGIDVELNFGTVSPVAQPEPGPPRDSYKPPSPAPEGFTRSIGEDEVVVCPNCDVELGTGDGVKQQIFVAKKCGHVRIAFSII
ncbi:hypothetical protein PHISCL_01485 [Aspergillus sclerotialis]|uniref:RING finger domain protein n=1 Tax=Aspergillus sclerotialis TaxID=2070753 RepID=A0A3A3A845_9EURO|nr:hypothetical protein PHISCL_01485 [Aspergillus sclerotialis]